MLCGYRQVRVATWAVITQRARHGLQSCNSRLETMPFKDLHLPENAERLRAYRRKHYHANKQPYIDRANARRDELMAWYREGKDDKPCADCGVRYPYYVMQYDHIGTDKEASIYAMVRRCLSKARISAEMAKCELVCANCHATRTWQRLQTSA